MSVNGKISGIDMADEKSSLPSKSSIVPALIISVFAISAAATLIKLAGEAPPVTIAVYRLGLSAGILWIYAGIRGVNVFKQVAWIPVSAAGMFLGIHFALWITSLSSTSVSSSLVLVTMNPILVAVGSWLILRERLTHHLIVGTIVSLAGCLILVLGEGRDSSSTYLGNLLALLGAVAMSSYMLAGRAARQKMHLVAYILWVYTFSTLILLVAGITLRQPLFGFSGKTYLFLVLVALIPQIIGHSLINWALRYIHPSYLAAVILMEPLAGSAMAYVFLDEPVSIFTFLGGCFILAGLIYLFRGNQMAPVDSSGKSV